MLDEVKISQVEVTIPLSSQYIGNDGNLHNCKEERFVLQDKNGRCLSKQYYYIKDLEDDHYAVCEIKNDLFYFSSELDSDMLSAKNYDLISSLKWGIIRIKRNKEGNIIPLSEEIIKPCVYDKIICGNQHTAIASNNGKYTYIDLDRNRHSYGNQMVPCVLENLADFNTSYNGFAKCIIDGFEGYLSRNWSPRIYIDKNDLLTEEQVKTLVNYLNIKGDVLDYDTFTKYFESGMEQYQYYIEHVSAILKRTK